MQRKTILGLMMLFVNIVTAAAQTTVTTHWPLDKSIKDLAVGTPAYNAATAATITCDGTDVTKMLETCVTFGEKLAFQAIITPSSYATKEVTGLTLLRFKVQGAADGTNDYGMMLSLKPNTTSLTFVPTKVSVSVASWVKNTNAAFEVLLLKLNGAGETTQTYELGTVNSHADVDAHYDDVAFDVPATATASNDAWQVVVRMAKGYQNGKNLAMGNITLTGTATLGGTVQTSTFTATVSPAGAGTVTPAETSVVTGDNVTCTATANIGYAFEGWYVGGTRVADDNPHTFKVDANMQAEARFTKLPEATLNYGTTTPGMGSIAVTPEGDNGKYNAGTTVTLTATPDKGHYFVRWVDGNGKELSTAQTYTLTLNEDRTVQAVFAMIDNYKADLITFPGAEGYGRFTTGGRMTDQRGAKVYYVTRLDDGTGEGTFRWAVTTGDDTPRTVLFRVAGTIYLKENVTVKPNTTIAGQTAPGGGVCIAGYRVKLSSNTVVRYLRFRAGDLPNKSMSPLGVENVENIVLDHCSLGWSMEENLTLYDNNNTTTQWCIFAEGLYNSRNVKGERAYGAQWGGKRSTMHHCLFANNNSRSPRFNGVRPENHDRQAINEFVNNVIYNWGSPNAIYGGENSAGGETDYNRVYMINNYYRPGPATRDATANRRYWVSASGDQNGVGQWYLAGNKFELSCKWAPATTIWSNSELQKVNSDNYYGFVANDASRAMNFWSLSPSQALADKCLLTTVVDELPYKGYDSADDAYAKVVSQAGCALPRYDEVDARVLAEAAGKQDPQFGGERGAKLGIIDTPYDITLNDHDEFVALYEGDVAADNKEITVTCYPSLRMADGELLMVDTDRDGMPDAYETAKGLNPNDATDGYRLTDNGYSNLELFLNGVADGTIDLAPYKFQQPAEKRQLFNAVVSPATASSGSAAGATVFSTIADAVADAEQQATKDSPYYILVMPGVYQEHVEINKPYIHLTGADRHNTVITDNKCKDDNGNLGKTATVYVNASDVSLDNLSIRNTYGSGKQALALYTLGDRITVTQCHITGWQDTYRTGKSGQRHLVRECLISGTTDFIYNAGDVFFDRDTLELTGGKNVIVAPSHIAPQWGYVFRDAFITTSVKSPDVRTNLGRPWGDTPMVSFIDTRLAGNVNINDEGWEDMDGLPTQMAEYNTVTYEGKPVDLSKRKTSFKNKEGKTANSKAVLTATEAAAYTVQNVLGGTDLWDADTQGRILDAPVATIDGDRLTWSDPTGQAVCYLLTIDGQSTITTDEQAAYSASSAITLQAVSATGILGRATTPGRTVGIDSPASASHAATPQQPLYTPSGARVASPRRGIVISEGKKWLKKP